MSRYTHPVDTVEMIKWLETLGGFALSDLFKSLDDDNLEASKAHAERLKMLEHLAPWIGANNAFLSIKMRYELSRQPEDVL